MSDLAIRIDGLGKRYRLGPSERYKTLRDTLAGVATAPVRWLRRGRHPGPEAAKGNGRARGKDTFWALRDVAFDVREGEIVGIIGRNAAGKSTLLKILSRITEPTAGEVELFGRVGSLL